MGTTQLGTASLPVVGGSGDELSAHLGMASGGPDADTAGVSALADDPRPDEERLELARLALLGRLARGVVHELNNPLFVVLALADLMLRHAEPGTQVADRLAQVRDSGLEMRGLVGAVGELARAPVETPLGPVGVSAVLGDAVDLVRRTSLRKDIDIVARFDDGEAEVLGRAGELRLAFLGILVEATEGTPEDGRIDVALVRRSGRAVATFRWSAGAERRALPVPASVPELDRILESVVAAHGGSLRRGPAPGGAAEAVVTLPLLDAGALSWQV